MLDQKFIAVKKNKQPGDRATTRPAARRPGPVEILVWAG